MTDMQNKFFPQDRQKAFDEIKEMLYARLKEAETASDATHDYGVQIRIDDEIEFICSVIDMMERS